MLDSARNFFITRRLGKSGKYLEAGGVRTYYEEYGRGEPLLMFHGGLSTLEPFRCQIPELSKHYRLILPERRGHGHTADTPGPYSYRQMAEDMAAFMRAIGAEGVKAVGYSDGANLIFHLALNHPSLLGSCVLIGGNFHYEGCTEEHRKEVQNLPEGGIGEQGVDEKYARYSPDGAGHYPVVFEKIRKLWLSEPTFGEEDIKKIQTPSLIISGDRDVITMAHTVKLYQALKNAQLLIPPGTTHRVIKENAEFVNRAILDFFKNPVYVNPYEDTHSELLNEEDQTGQ